MAIIVNGYRISTGTSPSNLSTILKDIKKNIENAQKIQYTKLLSEEINYIADMYVLGRINIPEGTPLIDVCKERVSSRIKIDSSRDVDTRYNFTIVIELVPHANRWYINVVSGNEMLVSGLFDNNKKIEPCRVVSGEGLEEECVDAANIWTAIHEEYSKDRIPLRQIYPPVFPLAYNEDAITFDPVNERAKINAENTEFINIFNCLVGGQQISPFDVPRYYEEVAKEMENNHRHQENIQMNYMALTSILPILTIDIIKQPCGFMKQKDEKKEEQPQIEKETDTPAT